MEQKKTNLKISKSLLTIGLVVFVLGIIFLIVSIISYNLAYDQWHDAWWNDRTADLNDQPTPVFIIVSVFVTLAGLGILISGAKPYLTKFALKHHKETLEYVGKDMTDVGTKMVDIGAPVANKAIDEVVIPTVKKVKNSITNDGEDSSGKMLYCRYCGKQIAVDSKFCNHCGEKQ